jgi:hypothetical protein
MENRDEPRGETTNRQAPEIISGCSDRRTGPEPASRDGLCVRFTREPADGTAYSAACSTASNTECGATEATRNRFRPVRPAGQHGPSDAAEVGTGSPRCALPSGPGCPDIARCCSSESGFPPPLNGDASSDRCGMKTNRFSAVSTLMFRGAVIIVHNHLTPPQPPRIPRPVEAMSGAPSGPAADRPSGRDPLSGCTNGSRLSICPSRPEDPAQFGSRQAVHARRFPGAPHGTNGRLQISAPGAAPATFSLPSRACATNPPIV